jgi:predicted PurR-regulated permease PerM/phosphoglycolate phosphatase-like HAD superfamily hydrolase
MVSTEWSHTTKRLVVVGLVIILLLILFLLRALLPPIAIAGVLAYLLKPIVDFLERRTGLPRLLAVILVFIVLLLIIAIIPATGVPYLMDRIARLNLDLQRLADDVIAFLSQPVEFFGFTFRLQDLVGDVQDSFQNPFPVFASQSVSLVVGVASSLLWILSVLIISFYLVKDADKFRSFLDRIAPPGHVEELARLREEINEVWKAFFRGQVIVGFIIGVLVWITMTAIGLPNAGLIALLAGMLEVIPTFGPIVASIAALITALFRGSTYLPINNYWFAFLVAAIYAVIHQIDNGYVVPRIMGRRLHLHPVIVFIGVLAGGILAGALGVFLAAPTIASLRVLLSYGYAKLLNREPFPRKKDAGELYPGEIDAIFFDLDGTLVETDDAAVVALAQRLRPLRRLLPNRDPTPAARHIVMALEGPANSFLTLMDRLGLDDNVLGLGDRVRRMRGVHTPAHFRPVDGIGMMLRDLSSRYHLGIVTTRSCREVKAFVDKQELGDLFQVIAGREDTWRIKPHPSPVLYAAEQLNVAAERCLMVGDTPVDIQAAQAAGAWSVGVLCGFGQEEELKRAGAHVVLRTTSELANWM